MTFILSPNSSPAEIRSFFNLSPLAFMNANGERLKKDLISAGDEFGLKMKVTGVPSMPYFRIEDQNKDFHIQWTDECLSRGLYLTSYHNHFLSVAQATDKK